jgi:hypothetical protein
LTSSLIAGKIPETMSNPENYQVKYWAGGDNYSYQAPKPKRSVKRKLAIVACFILVLAITPAFIYVLTNLNLRSGKEVSVASNQTQSSQPEVHPVTIEEPKAPSNQTQVLTHDSYWKISKRVCGSGRFYLSIQEQNGGKPLHGGDSVTVNCTL